MLVVRGLGYAGGYGGGDYGGGKGWWLCWGI